MYPIQEILDSIDSNPLVLLSAAPVFAAGFILYIEGIRVASRDKVEGVPWPVNMYNTAHDLAFLALYSRWFDELDHWAFKAFWIAFVFYAALELVAHYQTIKYHIWTKTSWNRSLVLMLYVVAQALVFMAFRSIHQASADYLFLNAFATTWLPVSLLNIAMLRRRGNRRGQSLFLAVSVMIGSSMFYLVFMPVLSPHFDNVPMLVAGIFVALMGIFYTVLLARTPADSPKQLTLIQGS